jgi:hypothetical protein
VQSPNICVCTHTLISKTIQQGSTLAMPMLEGFRTVVRSRDPANSRRSDDTEKHRFYPGLAPLAGKDLRPACLILLLGRLQRWCLQRWRRLDLVEGVELSRVRALGWMMEKVSREVLGSPSQPFICEGWVSGLLSKLTTDKGGLNKP